VQRIRERYGRDDKRQNIEYRTYNLKQNTYRSN
jgi:hypothetical protein